MPVRPPSARPSHAPRGARAERLFARNARAISAMASLSRMHAQSRRHVLELLVEAQAWDGAHEVDALLLDLYLDGLAVTARLSTSALVADLLLDGRHDRYLPWRGR